ncbi:MAG: hypothetical protein QXX12_00470 [Nanopusillaceae archaeon]
MKLKPEKFFTPEEKFREALKFCLAQKGRGALTKLAEALNRSPAQIYHIKEGIRPGDEKLKQQIALWFGYTYEEFLQLGAKLLASKDQEKTEPFEGFHEVLILSPAERYHKIIQLLTQEFQMSPTLFYTPNPAELEEKLKTEEGIIEVYNELRKKLEKAKEILQKYKHELEK